MTLKEQLESIRDNVYSGGDYTVEMNRLKQVINSTKKDAEWKTHLCNVVDAGIDGFNRRGYNKEDFDRDFSLVVFSIGSIPDKE